MSLDTAAKIATICSAVIAFLTFFYQLSKPRQSSRRKRSFMPNRTEVQLTLCILLLFFLGLAIPQVILPLFVVLLIIVYINLNRSKDRMRYTLSVFAITLAGLVGAYISAYSFAGDAGLPIFYSHRWRILDIWYLLN